MQPVRHIQFTNELRFARPREKPFAAFLDTDRWFQISYGQERLKSVVNERRVGGQIYEDWGHGAARSSSLRRVVEERCRSLDSLVVRTHSVQP